MSAAAARLSWPSEAIGAGAAAGFTAPGSNIALDLHGDPTVADLTVFSDGNHHMALHEALAAFRKAAGDAPGIFYLTTPPRVWLETIALGRIALGNLELALRPDVVIGPDEVIGPLEADGRATDGRAFMRSRGVDLMVRKGNPRAVTGLADLLRDDVRVALSHPTTERASHETYRAAARTLAPDDGLDPTELDAALGSDRIVHSRVIHHREIPQILAGDGADTAILYHHLALRFERAFPERFERAPLTLDHPVAGITRYRAARVGEGGRWGKRLLSFFGGPEVAEIYRRHGLAPDPDRPRG